MKIIDSGKMSGDHEEEEAETSSSSTSAVVGRVAIHNDVDDDDDDVVGDSTLHQDLSSREANYDSNNSNEDGVLVHTDNNGSGGDSDGVVVSEDAGREDMFLDAPEDLGADGKESSATFTEAQGSTDGDEDSSRVHHTRLHGLDNEMQNDYMVDEMERLRAMLDKTLNEKESLVRDHKDELDMATKSVANLRDQLRDFTNKQALLSEIQSSSHSHLHADADQAPLHEMIHECSTFLRSVMEDFQDLNIKSTEAAVSREVVSSYLYSVQNESTEVQFQRDQYMEDVTNRILSSFSSLVYVGDISDNSVSGKLAHIEKSVYAFIENYNWFLYQSDQLRQCLTEVRPDLAEQTDYGVIFSAANDELLGFRNKETQFTEKLSFLETEKNELKEQLQKHAAVAETANAELERLKREIEQEKDRYSNTKEKLSLAVTKGKALVQQRDSLKKLLAEKTSELENCLVALKEKSSALEAAEIIKEELVKSQISSASLQEVMGQKDLTLEKLEDILNQSGVPEGLNTKDITEKVNWLVDERDALKDVSLKFHQLADALLSIDLPENFSFSDLQSRLGWLTKSFDEAKAEIGILQDEISSTADALKEARAEIGAIREENIRIRGTAQSGMEHLTSSLTTVLVEKDYIEQELEDMCCNFETVVQREHLASSEKEQMIRTLLEASGVTLAETQPSEVAVIVEQCLATLKEGNGATHESSEASKEIVQNLQRLVYVKDHDLVLHENLFQEETQKLRMEMDALYSDLTKAREEIASLREQNENLKNDLERTEDKSALIREKLSMAVKKGKGLVQDREALKQLIEEKSSEIEKLKVELQQRESAISDYKSESSRLSAQVESIAKMEEDLLELKDQRDQLERDLLKSNGLILALTESVNRISLPADSSFEEPLDKLKRFDAYISECEAAKAQAAQQLENARLDVETLTTRVSEAHLSIKSLEEALTVAQEKISQLADEKTKLEVSQLSVQQQLERALQEASLSTEAEVMKKSLENALALSESNVSRLDKEKEEAESNRAAAEAELVKTRSEIASLADKLSKATTTVEELEDKVSHLETRISVLTDESNEAQIGRANLENELKKLKEESDSWDRKLQEAHSSIASLEDALTKSENDVSELANDKKAAEQEISTLSAKLNACLEELAGTHGSLESRSLELFDHLKGLELLGEDESVDFLLRKCCEAKCETLKEVEGLCRNIRGQFTELSPEHIPVSEESSQISKLLSTSHDDIFGAVTVTSHADAVESEDISVYVQKIVNNFQLRKKTFAEKVNGFVSFINECNASVLVELQSTSNWVAPMVQNMSSLYEKMKSMETDYQVLENKVTSLEDDITVLLSACSEATQLLESEIDKGIALNASTEFEVNIDPKFHGSKYLNTINMLLSASQKVSIVCQQFDNLRSSLSSTNEELQNNFHELTVVSNKAVEDRDLYRSKVSELETNIATIQDLCREQRLKLEIYEDLESRLRDKDLEISSLQGNLLMKEREAAEAQVCAAHVKSLLERADRIQVSKEASESRHLEPQDSSQMNKLFFIIDKFPEMQDQIESLSHEKEKLQTTLSDLLHKIEQLEDQVQESAVQEHELAMLRSKIVDIEAGLNNIIQKFDSGNLSGYQKNVALDDVVQVVEKLLLGAVLESENLNTKAHELQLEVEKSINTEQELATLKGRIIDMEAGVHRVIEILRSDLTLDQKHVASSDLVEVLENLVTSVVSDRENLKLKAHDLHAEVAKGSNEQELAEVKGELIDFEAALKRIIQKLQGDMTGVQRPVATRDLLQLLENTVMALIMESKNSKSKVNELDSKLLGSQKAVNELLLKVKSLEDSLQSRAAPPDAVRERSMFEAPAQPPASEISEIEDVGSVSKPTISPVQSSAHARTMRKGSSDHIAVDIDSETSRLIDNEKSIEDKGLFKSLNTSGLVPRQGKMIADRVDGIWVSGGRLLMSRPRARIGVIAYWLLLHMWLLGTIL